MTQPKEASDDPAEKSLGGPIIKKPQTTEQKRSLRQPSRKEPWTSKPIGASEEPAERSLRQHS